MDPGIMMLMGSIYTHLKDILSHMCEDITGKNPMLIAPLYMALEKLCEAFKVHSLPAKAFELLNNNIKSFECSCSFRSESLNKAIISLTATCEDEFQYFLVQHSQ